MSSKNSEEHAPISELSHDPICVQGASSKSKKSASLENAIFDSFYESKIILYAGFKNIVDTQFDILEVHFQKNTFHSMYIFNICPCIAGFIRNSGRLHPNS